jgi:hypothetical protein
MSLIAVIARRPFAFRGRDVQPGDRVETSPLEAVVLVTARKAAFARVGSPRRPGEIVPKRAVVTRARVTDDPATPPTKRTYKRRDLTVEP